MPDGEGGDDGGGRTEGDGEAPEADAAAEKVDDKPVTLGYKTFASGNQCYEYFHKLLTKLTPNQDLNNVRGAFPVPAILPCCGWQQHEQRGADSMPRVLTGQRCDACYGGFDFV